MTLFGVVTSIIQLLRTVLRWATSNIVRMVRSTLSQHDPQHLKAVLKSGPLPPGNMGYPIIGETIPFLTKSRNGEFFRERYAKYGSIFRTSFLGMKNIHVSDPTHARKILLGEHDLVTVHWPTAMRKLLGRGALANSVQMPHRCLRKSIKQAMNEKSLKIYIPTLSKYIAQELNKWNGQRRIDVYNSAKFLTMKAACEVLLGPDEIGDSVVGDLSKNFVIFGEGFFQLPIPFIGSKYSKSKNAKTRIIQIIKGLENKSSNRPSVLKSMYDQETSSTKAEQMDVAVELLFGAQETTACTITCAMYLLEKHPEVLRRLKRDVQDHLLSFGDDREGVALENLHSLRYLRNIMKETLRLFPPIGGGFRKVIKSFHLGGYQIPKGWTVTYSIKDMHDGSDLDEVTQFDPDRWCNANHDDALHTAHFLPFGAGARLCVGKEYASLFIKLALVALVKDYEWTIETKNPTFERVPIVRPEKPMMALFCKS